MRGRLNRLQLYEVLLVIWLKWLSPGRPRGVPVYTKLYVGNAATRNGGAFASRLRRMP